MLDTPYLEITLIKIHKFSHGFKALGFIVCMYEIIELSI